MRITLREKTYEIIDQSGLPKVDDVILISFDEVSWDTGIVIELVEDGIWIMDYEGQTYHHNPNGDFVILRLV